MFARDGILLVLSGLTLGGCCCCNLGSFVPDDLADELVERAVQEGVEAATGNKIDIDGEEITIEGEDGTLRLAQGDKGVDPRIPIRPHPGCEVAGGGVSEQKGKIEAVYAQPECAVTLEELVSHFEPQLQAVGGEAPRRIEASDDGKRYLSLQSQVPDSTDHVGVMIIDEGPHRKVAVSATLTQK